MGECERRFDLLMNAAGEVMIAFDATTSKPISPVFVYDGRTKGVLCKTENERIPFYPLPREAWDSLRRVKKILCVEVLNQHIVAEYKVPLEVRSNG
ncbi:MAG: hypothetical protein J6Y03_04500 [Alphaproteobacteria bacterium]|nr:hypothetical protein [Alphaproteobacteria bacterium]